MPTIPERPDADQRAFSLVEVALSLGIVAFAFVAILGLLPVGLSSNRDALAESRVMNLIQTVVADRKAAPSSTPSPVYAIPAFSALTTTTAGTLYLAEDGSSSATGPAANSLYRLNYTIYPSAGPNQPVLIYFAAVWPPTTTNTQPKVETVATFLP